MQGTYINRNFILDFCREIIFPNSCSTCRHCRRRDLQTPVSIVDPELSLRSHLLCYVLAHPCNFSVKFLPARLTGASSTFNHRRGSNSGERSSTTQSTRAILVCITDSVSTSCCSRYRKPLPSPLAVHFPDVGHGATAVARSPE